MSILYTQDRTRHGFACQTLCDPPRALQWRRVAAVGSRVRNGTTFLSFMLVALKRVISFEEPHPPNWPIIRILVYIDVTRVAHKNRTDSIVIVCQTERGGAEWRIWDPILVPQAQNLNT